MTPGSPYGDLGRMLLIFGIVLVVVGAFLLTGAKLPFRLGHLPGDVAYRGKSGSFYFPIVTCIILSIALTVISWIIHYFRR